MTIALPSRTSKSLTLPAVAPSISTSEPLTRLVAAGITTSIVYGSLVSARPPTLATIRPMTPRAVV